MSLIRLLENLEWIVCRGGAAASRGLPRDGGGTPPHSLMRDAWDYGYDNRIASLDLTAERRVANRLDVEMQSRPMRQCDSVNPRGTLQCELFDGHFGPCRVHAYGFQMDSWWRVHHPLIEEYEVTG